MSSSEEEIETGGESTSGGNRDRRRSEDDREGLYASSEGEVRGRCFERVCVCARMHICNTYKFMKTHMRRIYIYIYTYIHTYIHTYI